jgi:hypothetical protein
MSNQLKILILRQDKQKQQLDQFMEQELKKYIKNKK